MTSQPDPTNQPFATAAPRGTNANDPARAAGGLTTKEILKMWFDRRPLPMLTRNDIFFQGKSHIFAGQPKAGKTSLMRRVCYEWVLEGHRVVIFSEEDAEIWREQLQLLELEGLDEELLILDAMMRNADELLEVAITCAADIIVVDTISNILEIPNLNMAATAGPPIRRWVTAMRKVDKTLVLVHHLNARDEIAGSRYLRSIVDSIITYATPRAASREDEFLRIVTVRSRMRANNGTFAVVKRDGGPVFEVREWAGETTLTDPQREVYLSLDSTSGQTVKDLMAMTKFSESKVKRVLYDLQAKKLAGKRADTKGGHGAEAKWVKLARDEEEE